MIRISLSISFLHLYISRVAKQKNRPLFEKTIKLGVTFGTTRYRATKITNHINPTSEINRKCIGEAIKVLSRRYTEILHLHRRARDCHIHKLGVHPGH